MESNSVLFILLFVIVILTVSNFLMLYLWYRDHHQLIDKIMSKNYADYVTSQSYQKSISTTPSKLPIEESESDETEILKQLNSQLGV